MPEIFKNVFAGKVWFKSLTAWGLVLFAVTMAGVEAATGAGLIDQALGDKIIGYGAVINGYLVTLGIRKAASAPSVE